MSKRVLIIYAHPEPSSLTRQLVDVSVECLTAQGHEVLLSDLYAMGWKATFDEHDFPERANLERLSFGAESAHAYRHRRQSADVAAEQDKVLAADAVIFQFPLWWYGMPAIMKGWIDRVWAAGLAHGYKDAGNTYRYGDGAFKGKRALLSVAVGGPAADYSPRGINGPIEQLLFPITHGSLYFPGFDVLPTFAVYGTGNLTAAQATAAKEAWRTRLKDLFTDAPIPFRPQNGGDYTPHNELKQHVAVGQTGIMVHIASGETAQPQPHETKVAL
ncbi:NAD(P)H-dependent oxidoreductase [Pseudomonas sp. SZMC_28357]|uniref:NAD(P)H-dependent oxidoreductase n=1 Tax=Pseudomonas sp. SZMC_28357 TaxID=3074380 RepID=UPI002870D232|nr:NAD(P)H-dependent oxidoreductase [Pseudomonas sp. SZMC_28357]MDR9751530.1 NAD(P)H-dependent oxidoreductase [Pseudomonas sp. SZMC_28357]